MAKRLILIVLGLLTVCGVLAGHTCLHDELANGATLRFYDDLGQARTPAYHRLLLDSTLTISDISSSTSTIIKPSESIRIFLDYSQTTAGSIVDINAIKRIMEISALFFSKVIKLKRLDRLYFPFRSTYDCNILKVPETYSKAGTVGDLGIVVGNQVSTVKYVAKSASCILQKSDNRPIWGMIMWNNAELKFDQYGFQQVLLVGIHEITHIIAFSSILFELYPAGNPLREEAGTYYLSSEKIDSKLKEHFGCLTPKGIVLEDQDGNRISSHLERKVFGNEYMVSINKKGAFVSNFTLALLDSTGWYEINYTYAEPTDWGKNEGCSFMDTQDCSANQFCTNQGKLGCDKQATGYGLCRIDQFANTCRVTGYYTNTICIDELAYTTRGPTKNLNTLEYNGPYSRCVNSTILDKSMPNSGYDVGFRCYKTVCAYNSRYIFYLVGNNVIIPCIVPGYRLDVNVSSGDNNFAGTLTCPSDFSSICNSKKVCLYHCNKNGLCLNGECLCINSDPLTPGLSQTCMDTSMLTEPTGVTGGVLNSIRIENDVIILINRGVTASKSQTGNIPKQNQKPKQVKNSSINMACLPGTFLDKEFGQCLRCQVYFGCPNCNQLGCWGCPDGSPSKNGTCGPSAAFGVQARLSSISRLSGAYIT